LGDFIWCKNAGSADNGEVSLYNVSIVVFPHAICVGDTHQGAQDVKE